MGFDARYTVHTLCATALALLKIAYQAKSNSGLIGTRTNYKLDFLGNQFLSISALSLFTFCMLIDLNYQLNTF